MNTKQRMRKVLGETIEYYDSPEKFGYANGSCEYLSHKGQMCAIGRVLKNPESLKHKQSKSFWRLSHDYQVSDEDFKEEYQGLPHQFWCDLQELHDSAAHDGYHSIKANLMITQSRGFGFFEELNKFIEDYEGDV